MIIFGVLPDGRDKWTIFLKGCVGSEELCIINTPLILVYTGYHNPVLEIPGSLSKSRKRLEFVERPRVITRASKNKILRLGERVLVVYIYIGISIRFEVREIILILPLSVRVREILNGEI